MRPGILPRLSLDLLGIRLFKESRQLRAELGKMKIVRLSEVEMFGC